MVQIVVDSRDLLKLVTSLDKVKNGVERALAPAINTALANGRTVIKREIRKQYTIKAKDIPITLHRASYKHLVGEFRIDQGMLPLEKFELHPRGFTHKRKLIFARVKRGKGGYLRHNAFFIPRGGPYHRLGPERYPIAKMVTISAAIMASQPEVENATRESMGFTLEKRINHEIERVLATSGK